MNEMYFPIVTEFDEKLPYYFHGAGCNFEQEHVKRPGDNARLQWCFPYYQWIQTRSGKGELILNGSRFSISEGQGMLLIPNEQHEYYAVTDKWYVDWIVFGGHGTDQFFKNVLGINASGAYYISAPNVIAEKMQKILRISETALPTKNIACSAAVYDILTCLLTLTAKKPHMSINDKSTRIQPAIDYIRAHYTEPLSLEVLANQAQLTPQYFCQAFKKLTAHTPFEYINMVRIHKSKELFRSGKNITIKEAALASGFNDISYFCSVFKRLEGVTAAEFRDGGLPSL